MNERYYDKYAVAAVRGAIKRKGLTDVIADELMEKELELISEEECEQILRKAEIAGIKLYHFKATHSEMPRVKKVLGFLRGIYFESLLDVGSGRGVFLIPFMDAFPYVKVTSFDILERRVEMLNDLREGGVHNLDAYMADICNNPLGEKCVDVVTMLEVLEHIPDTQAAVNAAVAAAKQYVVLTVPSKEDDNPEHIHLLTKEKLTEYFGRAGVTKLTFGGVPGHLFMIAKIG